MGFKTLSCAMLAAIVASQEPSKFEQTFMYLDDKCTKEMTAYMKSSPKKLQEIGMEYMKMLTPMMMKAMEGTMLTKNLKQYFDK